MDQGQSLQLVKCYLTDCKQASEIRRFTLEKKDVANFDAVRSKMRALYPQLKDQDFCVFYMDEDGDKIVISSDDELLAYNVTNREVVMKFNIELINSKKHVYASGPSRVKEELGSCKGNLHEHVICDVCESQIRGFRYKCMKCPDYDLCGRCEAAGNHPGHMMARVSGPLDQFPKVFRAVRGVDGSWLAQGQKWGHRGAQGCNARRAGTSDAESGRQQGPRHVNFDFKVPGPCAARNVGQEREREYLMNVGSVLASQLESLGIDTHVHVHTETSGNVHCYPSGACQKANRGEQEAAAAAAAVNASQAAAAAQAAATATAAQAAAAASAMNGPENGDACTAESKISTTTVDEPENWDVPCAEGTGEEPAADAEEPENLDSPAVVETLGDPQEIAAVESEAVELPQQELSTSKTSSSDSGDWTFVDDSKHEEEKVEILDSPPQENDTASPKLTASSAKTTEGQNELYPNLNSLEPVHPDPKIAAALESMLAMGFTNEGGWLSQLLEVKGGDIAKVMDVLHGPF